MLNSQYSLSSNIYMAQFCDQVILLDVKNDKYRICSDKFAEVLIKIAFNQSLIQCDQDALNTLLKFEVVHPSETPYPYYIDCKPHSVGVSNVDWRLPLHRKKTSCSLSLVNVYLYLSKVNFYIKFKGLDQALKLIKNSRRANVDYIIPSANELNNLAGMVNMACHLYPSRTKCLEWAMTYVLLALQKGWKCNLEIGVQNYPFMAHAWVECNEQVLLDSPDLREGLAIVLSEPFRKHKL